MTKKEINIITSYYEFYKREAYSSEGVNSERFKECIDKVIAIHSLIDALGISDYIE